ncbi:hypothetical protein Nepgr_002763 [Nepenthes gracilis]|uniref:Uncharacterized protein n=1 Tax=Nepenthes gracilis TaxID=150966 RepID=A0AAD3PA11_NEPGR|nr:hypothetical protein Nepgr_002763 [Nepenthes gracilis]
MLVPLNYAEREAISKPKNADHGVNDTSQVDIDIEQHIDPPCEKLPCLSRFDAGFVPGEASGGPATPVSLDVPTADDIPQNVDIWHAEEKHSFQTHARCLDYASEAVSQALAMDDQKDVLHPDDKVEQDDEQLPSIQSLVLRHGITAAGVGIPGAGDAPHQEIIKVERHPALDAAIPISGILNTADETGSYEPLMPIQSITVADRLDAQGGTIGLDVNIDCPTLSSAPRLHSPSLDPQGGTQDRVTVLVA